MNKDTQSLEVKTYEPSQMTLAQHSSDPVLKLIQKVVDGGITEGNVAALDKLLGVYERLDEKRAEREFAAAFVALQSEIPVIVASTVIQNRGKYERFEDVSRVVNPLLAKHGFSISFSMDFRDGRILETCTLAHVGGHSRANSFAVRTGKADSDTQADCKAATTAKRNALLNCLNIVVRQDALQSEDEDASLEGAAISVEQVCFLRELVAQTKSDVAAFLAFAGAAKFEEIPTSRYERLVAALRRKAGAA